MRGQIDLPFLASKLFNTPHLLASSKLDVILSSIAPRVFDGGKLPAKAYVEDDQDLPIMPPEAYRLYGAIAVIPVHGTLIRRGAWLGSLSGLTSYDGLKASFEEAIFDPNVAGVLLDIDSPGGEAGGVFDLTDHMRILSKRYNKPIWSHANEQASSAGYALACAGEKIWVARTGDIGSIGVVCAHLDQSKADEKAGHKWTYIYEGEHKIYGNPHEPLSDAAGQRLQEESSTIYDIFVETVVNSRAMTEKQVRATKADTYIGENAIAAGLADCVGTFDQALEALSALIEKKSNTAEITREGKNKWHPQNTTQDVMPAAQRTTKRKKSLVKTKRKIRS